MLGYIYQGGGCSVPYPVYNSDSPSVVEQSQGTSFSCISFIILCLWSVEYPMPYASCLASCSEGWRLSCSSVDHLVFHLFWGTLMNGALLVCYFGLLQPLLFRMFCIAHWDSLLGYVHCGIACLASQASYLSGALWDGLSGLWLVSLC